jgi:hypothetical protein
VLTVPTVEILMCNTDGFEFIVDREYEHLTAQKCKEWEGITNLILEDVTYSKMIVSDVNNYLSVTTKGDIKMKGKYEWKDLPAHKNQSCLIVKIAAEKYLLEGIDPEEFIRGHKDKFDFMLRTKVPRSSKLVLVDDQGVDNQVQNICRYYVSEKGGELVKVMPPLTPTKTEQVWVNNSIMDSVTISSKTDITKYEKNGYVFDKFIETECPDRRLSIEAGWKCKVTNDMKDFDWDIDYQYYIERVWKLVNFANDEDAEVVDEIIVETE